MKNLTCPIIISEKPKIRSIRPGFGLAAVFIIMALGIVSISLLGCGILAKAGYSTFIQRTTRNKHSALVSKIKKVEEQTTEYQRSLVRARQFNNRIRRIFALPSINEGLRKAGIGGLNVATGMEAKILQANRQIAFELIKLKQTHIAISEKLVQYQHLPLVSPASGKITSRFGLRIHPILGRIHFHTGIDIKNSIGTVVHASAAGIVSKFGYHRYSGRFLKIDHGYGYESLYKHIEDTFVVEGQIVSRNQPIASLGNTGRSTGPHLHYEVRKNNRPLNPEQFILPVDVVFD